MSEAEYVALGSSFAAGPGLPPRADGSPRRSGRSAVNYAHLYAASAGLRLRDVTFSGATTADLLSVSARGVPAQLDAVTPATRLVTMSIGGNDIGYLGTLALGSLPSPVRRLPRIRRRLADALDAGTVDARFDAMSARLHDVLRRVRTVAPQARVILVDYLTILPPLDAEVDLGALPQSTSDWGRSITSRMTSAFRSVAGKAGCELLPAAEASRDHHAWSPEPWTRRFRYGSRDGAPYHPNAAGMRAVARMLEEHVGNGTPR
ncbi:SGNH/GDSL hydrolase family protein [Leifsonia xyli]|uniref:SGNH/GDSL hydrolase family protein n=1 Tax=Leifsonia xyli TaxID=1575 RepID=UPI003D668526